MCLLPRETFAHKVGTCVCLIHAAAAAACSGKLQVGVREYYEEGGELKPSMKGLNMLPDEWEVFCEAVPEINKQLANTAAAPAAAAVAARAPAAAPAASAGPRKAAAAAGGGAAAAAGGGGAAAEVQLGGKKRAAISMFTGSACVDLRWVQAAHTGGRHVTAWLALGRRHTDTCSMHCLVATQTAYHECSPLNTTAVAAAAAATMCPHTRECYEKDGELRPGKKGIMLRPDQWRMLVDAAGAVTDALTAHNTRYTLELGNK